jgi:hypothetical protein
MIYDDCREYEVPCLTKEGTFLAELIEGFLISSSYLVHPIQNVFLNYVLNSKLNIRV